MKNSVLLSGTLLEDLRGVAGATVSFFATDRNAGTAKTERDAARSQERSSSRSARRSG